MRRSTVLPGLIALVIGVLLARRRWRASNKAPAPIRAFEPVADLPAGPAAEPPEAVVPAPHFLSVPWHLVEPPADDTQLGIGFTCSQHMTLDRVDVQETPSQVFVTVLVRWQPAAGGAFGWDAEQQAEVELARPLGDRELVHGTTDLEDASGRPLYP